MKAIVVLAAVLAAACALPARPDPRALSPKLVPAAGPGQRARNATHDVHIQNGKYAQVGQFPWMANIIMDEAWYCGGALISDKLILTAAQCASGYARFFVSLGDVHTYADSDSFSYAYTYKSCWHDDYMEEVHLNDIGLIELLYPVKFSDAIQPIALPSQSQDDKSWSVGATATVSGFGTSEYGFESTDLMYAEQPIIDNGMCARYLGKNVKDTNICGDGAGGIGTCAGDAGDPLAVEVVDSETGASSWVLVGLSSFQSDVDCGLGYPSAYTRVTAYLDWIQKKSAGGNACYQ